MTRNSIFAAAPLLAAACAALSLTACATGTGHYAGGDIAYYDDFYGPFDDGYWGGDGVFMYGDGHGGWRHDDGGHFHHVPGQGFHGVQGHGQAFRGGMGGGHRG